MNDYSNIIGAPPVPIVPVAEVLPDPSPAQLFVQSYKEGTFFLGGSRRMRELYEIRRANEKQASPDRFAKGIDKATDWDFYATYTPELEEVLKAEGFTETQFSALIRKIRQTKGELADYELEVLELAVESGDDYALDDEAITIYQKNDTQVVLRKDALFYKRVFDNIDVDVYIKYLWKSSPEKIGERSLIQPFFNMLFKIAHAAEGK